MYIVLRGYIWGQCARFPLCQLSSIVVKLAIFITYSHHCHSKERPWAQKMNATSVHDWLIYCALSITFFWLAKCHAFDTFQATLSPL